jgi:hypothetical protein
MIQTMTHASARFRLNLRTIAVGLLMAAVMLNSVLVVLTALHETTHLADAGHAHVDHADHGDHSSPEDAGEGDDAVLLHLLMHAGQCCGQSAALLPATPLLFAPPAVDTLAVADPPGHPDAGRARLLRPPILG